jgi:large subunit ribosomal protein L6
MFTRREGNLAQVEVASETVLIPIDVKILIEDGSVAVLGPLGEIKKDFSHAKVDIIKKRNEIQIEVIWPDKKKKALVGTISSLIRNMITGVTKGYTYKLKIVFAHFPMTVRVEENRAVVENFHGERKPRIGKILGDVKVEVMDEDVIVKGIDLNDVSQTAANIQEATWIKKKDHRVFLDGIYIYEKSEGM